MARRLFHRSRRRDRWSRPPRLLVRFAIYTAIGLAVAGGAILLVVRSYATTQAENAIAFHARFVAEVALGDRLRPSDFDGPVDAKRIRVLDRLFHRQVLLDGIVRGTLYAKDGTVTYSSDHRLIGRRTAESVAVQWASRGTHVKSTVRRLGDAKGRKVVAEFVPVRFGHAPAVGVFAFDQDYGPVARAARSTFLPIIAVLELLLVVLYVSLFPILRRVTRHLRGHVEELEHHALHDSLTGLPNRALFRDRLRQSIAGAGREGNTVAVMLLDLDGFKEVNDTLGHQSGDELLSQLGSRLARALRETDTIARLGGDEFGILLPLESDADVAQAVERLRAVLETPVVLDGLTVAVGASIGVAFHPEHGRDVGALHERLDVAMYAAKERRSAYEIYTESRDFKDASKLTLAGELRTAISEGRLELHYQPKAELRSGRVDSVEALVRWQHPDRGLLLPSEFVPLAEQTGLIRSLTNIVLDQAVQQCSLWRRAGLATRVAVNLDVRDLLDLEFPDRVDRLLQHWGVDARSLVLEITESTLMSDRTRIGEVAGRLSSVGVSLSIDDFGTGYTSLRQLKSLPVDELKIDSSFVTDVTEDSSDAAILRAMIELGRNLGLRVVAEGVDSPGTWQFLGSLDCDLAQGFFVAHPLPAAEVQQALRSFEAGSAPPLDRRVYDAGSTAA